MCEKKQFKYCPSEIDECMRNFVKLINLHLKEGQKTVASCCGHGIYPMTLLIKCNGITIDFFSGNVIPRKKKFYKKDSKGYYYIPEVSDEKN